MTQIVSKIDSLKILNSVPFEKGFHFTENGNYTGITAISLPEFIEKLRVVNIESIQFHYSRGDFQNWIQETIGDLELANRMCYIKSGTKGERLREQLLRIVQNRMSELQKTQKNPN